MWVVAACWSKPSQSLDPNRSTPEAIDKSVLTFAEPRGAFTDFAHHTDGTAAFTHWHALVQNVVHLH